VVLGKVTERAAARRAGFFFGAERVALTLTGADRCAELRALAACAPFCFFIDCPLSFRTKP
jgi:hypothetical protein